MSDLAVNFDNIASVSKPVNKLKATSENLADEQLKIKTAKNFESLLLNQLVSAMKDTVDESEFAEDNAGKQINDMFYSFLADDMSDKGGMGIWKEIYKMMDTNTENPMLDESI